VKPARLLLFPLLLASASAVGTPANTVITNQATATAEPLNPGDPRLNLPSNIVQATVASVCAPSLSAAGSVLQPGQSQTLLPGDTAQFVYTLTNSGNIASTFNLSTTFPAGGAFIADPVAYYQDSNGNGVLDAAEQTTPVTAVTLAADASVTLFLLAGTSEQNRGDAFVDPVVSCVLGADTVTPPTSGHVARLRVGEPPAVTVSKTFSPALIKPGDTTTVTVTARNDGQGASGALILKDTLTALATQGLRFVQGSASASLSGGGSVAPQYSQDGVNYQFAETDPVLGVQASVPALAPAQSLTLTFKMIAGPEAENQAITNTAVASTSGKDTTGSATLQVRYTPGVQLGPIGHPDAAEGTDADRQTRAFAVKGELICFDHTLLNSGDVADRFTLGTQLSGADATVTYRDASGAPLAQPVTLVPGASTTVQVCYTVTSAGSSLSATVTATGTRGESNATQDLIARIETARPTLLKTVDREGTRAPGDLMTYTLRASNPYQGPLTALTYTDTLPAGVEFVSADQGGTYDAATRTVTWTLPTLAQDTAASVHVTVKVSAADADDTRLDNTFALTSSEVPTPTTSNTVTNTVWSAPLIITKAASNLTPGLGETETYTVTVKNASQTADLPALTVTDSMPIGLEYRPGSSTLAGKPVADPQVSGTVQTGQTLTYTGLPLAHGQTLTLTYGARLTPLAASSLVNTVTAKAISANAATITSNTAQSKVTVQLQGFAPIGDIVGMVYLDQDSDKRFDPAVDVPVAGARILLAGGRSVLTDALGRYHFAQVRYGEQALKLDPSSVPRRAVSMPQDLGRPGTRTVTLTGLTGLDFPLAALSGQISVLRRTTLTIGSFTALKTVYRTGTAYHEVLTLNTPVTLDGFSLSDPLPAGAIYTAPLTALPATLPAGETVLTSDYTFDGSPGAAVTDPTATWSQK